MIKSFSDLKKHIRAKLERALLFWEIGCRGLAISAVQRLLPVVKNNKNIYLNLTKLLSKWCFKVRKYKKASQLLYNAFLHLRLLFDFNLLFLLTEIFMKKSLFQEIYDILRIICCFNSIQENIKRHYIDLRAKTKICSVRCGYYRENKLFLNLYELDLEKFGYAIIDSINNYKELNWHQKSLDLLKPLIGSPKWDYIAIFLKVATFHRRLGDIQLLQEVYYLYLMNKKFGFPEYNDAIFELSDVYKSFDCIYFVNFFNRFSRIFL